MKAWLAAGVVPIVRVPVPMAHWVAMALDAGAAGVLIPYCETVEEVRDSVGTARLHPLKGEYLRRAIQDGVFPSPRTKEYLENRRRESIVLVGIESEPGQRNLDAILDVGGIDGIFIGPNDMTTNMGIPNEYDHPDFIANVQKYDPYRSRAHIERTVKYNMLQRPDGKYISKCDGAPRRLGIVRGTGPLENIELADAAKFDLPVLSVRGEKSNILTQDAAERFAATLPKGHGAFDSGMFALMLVIREQ